MTRKEFLKLTGPATLVALSTGPSFGDNSDTVNGSGRVVALENSAFKLQFQYSPTVAATLIHKPTGIVLAQGPYSYSPGQPVFSSPTPGTQWVDLTGQFDNGLKIDQSFSLPDDGPWLEERVRLTNATSHPMTVQFRCGFVLPVAADTLKDYVFTAVPYRREPNGGPHQYADYKLDQILYERRRSHLRNVPILDTSIVRQLQPQLFTEDYISEAWALTDGKNGFLISKYNQARRDFAILDNLPIADGGTGLRWGGAGGPMIDPEGCLRLAPGQTCDFGVTRLTAFSGDLTQGFYTYRAETDSRGHALPANYDPPSQWNELYDNKLWWTGNSTDADLRKKYYSLPDLKLAAARAQDMGLEALYCDPGWDTPQSSHIWGAERLGPLPDFLAMLKNQYGGLRLSLHTPLSSWSDSRCDLPDGSEILPEDGSKPHRPCGASSQYVDATVKRLGDLAAAGVAFFMFDGTSYFGECWSKDHGHSYPATTAEYVDMENKIAWDIHKDHPDVLIEMHDQLFGGVPMRYCPSYYGHGLGVPGKKGWDEIWAFELMWSPMDDLVGGHSIALYYFNLAYSIPLYIHIDLRQDNPQCLMLWWSISTCRHLGVGGTHGYPSVVASQRNVIGTYRRLKRYFCNGTFYGINELTHVHVHPDKKSAVINCFNLTQQLENREIKFDPALYGMATGPRTFSKGTFTLTGNVYIGKVLVAGFGHELIEIT
jgi:hypothetical protein